MAAKTLQKIFTEGKFLSVNSLELKQTRLIVSKRSGASLPQPEKVPFGFFRVIFTVIPGLLIGATISKTIANFLEENDLFVPADDDDDDDD